MNGRSAWTPALTPLFFSRFGMFFSFDGIDGAGKSSQIDRLVAWLQQRGLSVEVCRDPGSTPLGEQLRRLLLDRDGPQIDAMAEMLLYMAARAQLVESVIRPALAAGKAVVTDRFLLANVVYQGHAGGDHTSCDLEGGTNRHGRNRTGPDVLARHHP